MYKFNFPEIECKGILDQSMKVIEEAGEVELEAHRFIFYKNNKEKIADELLDTIQACETFLRYICSERELQDAYISNVSKNRSRGYFKG